MDTRIDQSLSAVEHGRQEFLRLSFCTRTVAGDPGKLSLFEGVWNYHAVLTALRHKA